MCCHRSVPVCESLTLCLFFSLCRWWAGKKQSANIIRVRTKVTHDCCYFLFYIRFFAYFDSEGNCAAFSLRCNKVWLDSFTLSCVRLANNDLLSLDPFSPTLAAGSSHSVSSSTGNTSFHLDSCGRVFLHDARFYISTVSLNKMCTTNKGSLWFLFKLVLLRFQSSVGLATLVVAGGNSKFKAAANMCRAATLSGIQQTNKWFICLECSQTNSHCFNEEVSQ